MLVLPTFSLPDPSLSVLPLSPPFSKPVTTSRWVKSHCWLFRVALHVCSMQCPLFVPALGPATLGGFLPEARGDSTQTLIAVGWVLGKTFSLLPHLLTHWLTWSWMHSVWLSISRENLKEAIMMTGSKYVFSPFPWFFPPHSILGRWDRKSRWEGEGPFQLAGYWWEREGRRFQTHLCCFR